MFIDGHFSLMLAVDNDLSGREVCIFSNSIFLLTQIARARCYNKYTMLLLC